MVTTQDINKKWWTHRSHESQVLNTALATKEEDEKGYLKELKENLAKCHSCLDCVNRYICEDTTSENLDCDDYSKVKTEKDFKQ